MCTHKLILRESYLKYDDSLFHRILIRSQLQQAARERLEEDLRSFGDAVSLS